MTTTMGRMDLHVSPLGRVEGDLDLRVTLEDGVVTQAWTEAGMFRRRVGASGLATAGGPSARRSGRGMLADEWAGADGNRV